MKVYRMIIIIILYLLPFYANKAYCSEDKNALKKEQKIKSILKEAVKENLYQYFVIPDIVDRKDSGYAIIIERDGFIHSKITVYKVNNQTGKIREIFKDDDYRYVMLRIMPIPKGFITTSRAGMGRFFKFFAYIEDKNRMKSTFLGHYDFVELAYYRGYNAMPHLFATEVAFAPQNNSPPDKDWERSGFYFVSTDVYEWDKKDNDYKLVKTIKYGKETKFEDRFKKFKKEKIPIFTPHSLFLIK